MSGEAKVPSRVNARQLCLAVDVRGRSEPSRRKSVYIKNSHPLLDGGQPPTLCMSVETWSYYQPANTAHELRHYGAMSVSAQEHLEFPSERVVVGFGAVIRQYP